MYISSSKSLYRKAVLTSICSTSRSRLAANPSTVRMDVIFTTSEKILSKSTPFLWLNPLTTSLALYHKLKLYSSCLILNIHLFFKALFLLAASPVQKFCSYARTSSLLAWLQSISSWIHHL